ncbi:hypothetical protein TcBrA4_0077750 [Trypanosoma cruzi]|nr:hypothetical protein TcBrA4_0077750 [Trypanosoma cruzi]
MEFGVTLHSVFIGLTVGITSDAETKALLVALVFHQMFEGLALGSRLADASMRISLELLLALIFSISAHWARGRCGSCRGVEDIANWSDVHHHAGDL